VRRRASVVLVPLIASTLMLGIGPAVAEEADGATVAAEQSPEPTEGQGAVEPAALPDETAGTDDVADRVAPDGTALVTLAQSGWTRAGDLPVRVRGQKGSPSKARVTFSTGSDVNSRAASNTTRPRALISRTR